MTVPTSAWQAKETQKGHMVGTIDLSCVDLVPLHYGGVINRIVLLTFVSLGKGTPGAKYL